MKDINSRIKDIAKTMCSYSDQPKQCVGHYQNWSHSKDPAGGIPTITNVKLADLQKSKPKQFDGEGCLIFWGDRLAFGEPFDNIVEETRGTWKVATEKIRIVVETEAAVLPATKVVATEKRGIVVSTESRVIARQQGSRN